MTTQSAQKLKYPNPQQLNDQPSPPDFLVETQALRLYSTNLIPFCPISITLLLYKLPTAILKFFLLMPKVS